MHCNLNYQRPDLNESAGFSCNCSKSKNKQSSLKQKQDRPRRLDGVCHDKKKLRHMSTQYLHVLFEILSARFIFKQFIMKRKYIRQTMRHENLASFVAIIQSQFLFQNAQFDICECKMLNFCLFS